MIPEETIPMRVRLLRTFFTTLSIGSLAVSQDISPIPLTIERAVQLALERNKDLVSSRLDVDKAKARVTEAWGYAMPSVDLSGRYTKTLKKPIFFLPDFDDPGSGRINAVKIGADHSFELTAEARQSLFNYTVFTGVGAARIYSQAAREMHEQRKLETILKVRKAYYGVLLAKEVADLMRSNLRNAEENLRTVEVMTRQGVVSEYDELRAQVGVENLRPAVIQAENNHALSLDVLKAAIGLRIEEQFSIADSLAFTPTEKDLAETALESVTQQNVGLRALRLQVEINRAFLSVERSNYLPSIAAFGRYQYQAAKNQFRISTSDFFASAQVGVQLSFNVFQGFQTNARVEQADVEVRKTEEAVSNLETNLRTATHSIILQIQQAKQRLDAQQRTVGQADRGYRIATTRFKSGSGTQLEINDAQLALTQAKVNRMQAVFDYLVASADLEQILGIFPTYVPTSKEE